MSPGRRFINALIGTAEREGRIDVAKAAVLREMAAIDRAAEALAAERAARLFGTMGGRRWDADDAMRAFAQSRKGVKRKCELHALLEDDDALLAWAERRAGALSVADTAGGELSEVRDG